jgi:predicted nucleic acid-binding protein
MRRCFVDTSVCIAAQRGSAQVTAILQGLQTIAVNPVVAGELYLGASLSGNTIRNRRRVAAFLESPNLRMLPISADTAPYYALIKTQLQRKGRPIPDNDVWIAASAMEHGLALLTQDHHFDHVEGLLLANDLLAGD